MRAVGKVMLKSKANTWSSNIYSGLNIKKDSGNATVEMAIVFPIALFSILALILYSIICYQKLSLNSTLNSYTEKLAPFVTNGIDENKLATLEEAIINELERTSVFGKNRCQFKVSINYENGILSKKLSVVGEALVTLPFGRWIEAIGISNPLRINARSEIKEGSAKAFINNIDLLLDIAKRSGLETEEKELSGED